MSRLSNEPVVTAPEPAFFEEDKQAEPEAYTPQHPMLAELEKIRGQHVAKPDHLDKYVEVDPFAKKEAVEETAAEQKE